MCDNLSYNLDYHESYKLKLLNVLRNNQVSYNDDLYSV